jgi:hypothetical protein
MFTKTPNFYLARALYIPAIVIFINGVFCLYTHNYTNAALSGILGTLFGILALCAAIKSAGLINTITKIETGE